MEVFVNLDLAQLAAIVDSEALPSLMAQPYTDHGVVGGTTAGKFTLSFKSVYHCRFPVRFLQGIRRCY